MEYCTPEFEGKHLLRYHHGDSEADCIDRAIDLFVSRQKAGSLETGGRSTALFVRKKYRHLLDYEIGCSIRRGTPNEFRADTQAQYIRKAVTIQFSMLVRTYLIEVISRPKQLRFQTGTNGQKCNHFVGLVGGVARSSTKQLASASRML